MPLTVYTALVDGVNTAEYETLVSVLLEVFIQVYVLAPLGEYVLVVNAQTLADGGAMVIIGSEFVVMATVAIPTQPAGLVPNTE